MINNILQCYVVASVPANGIDHPPPPEEVLSDPIVMSTTAALHNHPVLRALMVSDHQYAYNMLKYALNILKPQTPDQLDISNITREVAGNNLLAWRFILCCLMVNGGLFEKMYPPHAFGGNRELHKHALSVRESLQPILVAVLNKEPIPGPGNTVQFPDAAQVVVNVSMAFITGNVCK